MRLDNDVIMSCSDCPVGASELAALARWLRQYDLVVEGTYVGADSLPEGYERRRPLARIVVERVVRGVLLQKEARILFMSWHDLPIQGTRVLAWILRGCTIDHWPCGNYVTITPRRAMMWHTITEQWHRESSLLSCDSLEADVAQRPDSTGLDAFDEVDGVGLASARFATRETRLLGGSPRAAFRATGVHGP
jgi:hypothetical protein